MKINITKTVEITECVDVDFPVYFCDSGGTDYSGYEIYGKIEENGYTAIKESECFNGSKSFELCIEPFHASKYSCYLTKECASTEVEYLAAKDRLVEALRHNAEVRG